MATVNRQLEDILQVKNKQINRDEINLEITREALQHIPIPMLGVDDDGMIAFVNLASEQVLFKNVFLLGANIDEILPSFTQISTGVKEGENFALRIANFNYLVNCRTIGSRSKSRGKLITFFRENSANG